MFSHLGVYLIPEKFFSQGDRMGYLQRTLESIQSYNNGNWLDERERNRAIEQSINTLRSNLNSNKGRLGVENDNKELKQSIDLLTAQLR